MEWLIPPGNLNPDSERIDLWRCRLDLPAERIQKYASLLSSDERERADRFAIESKRNQFIVGRGFLRRTLGLMLDANPRRFVFEYGPKGKPAVSTERDVRFNLSHAGHWALLAVTRNREVGIDIELKRPRPHLRAMAERFFSAEEIRQLASVAEEDLADAFYTCWCRKEAVLKAAGEGIWLGLDTFAVTALPREPARLIRLDWPQTPIRSWSLLDVSIDPQHAAALAHEGTDLSIGAWDPAALPAAPADARGIPRIGAA